VRQWLAGKNVSMEAEDIVKIRHQATTGEDRIVKCSHVMYQRVQFIRSSMQNPVNSHTHTRNDISTTFMVTVCCCAFGEAVDSLSHADIIVCITLHYRLRRYSFERLLVTEVTLFYRHHTL
jgi:hypothetical protein